ncbi:hypothetical protein ACQ4PT_051554 [Festuca glaucescens]
MCAFDLLATVAGSLLGDQGNSSSVPNIGTAASSYARKRKSVKAEQCDDVLLLNSIAVGNCIVGSGGACASPRQTNICSAENSSTRNETDSVLESLTVEPNMLVKDSLFSCTKSFNRGHGLGGISGCCPGAPSLEANQLQVKQPIDGDAAALYSLVSSVDLDGRPPALVSSDSSSGMPLCSHDKDRNTSGLCHAEVQHAADRDDDENSSGCTHPYTTGNKSYAPHYTGDSRIRKLFASKFRKAARNRMCGEMSNKVKLRIKSFTIPELFIEIPENATIGLLKRTVMDVVTSIIEGGLRVGVFLEGKNIQDDSKTLRQARICHGENLDNVDFTLECEAAQNSSPGVRTPEEMDFLGADAMKPLAMIKCEEPFSETKASGYNQHSVVEMTMQETSESSRAIVPVASPNAEALAIVPVSKSKRATMGQRRIRRPFSLPEVESLVDAVEQLGTGRWRDVKMLAFDNTDHRTYVDLKVIQYAEIWLA